MQRIYLAMAVTFILISCTSVDNIPSILDEQVCGTSCWNDITIGKTTRQDLKEIIAHIPNADQSSVVNLENPDTYVFFQVYRDGENKKFPVSIGIITNDDNLVSRITFLGNLGLTAQEITDVLGEPDFASSQWSGDGDVCVNFISSIQGYQFSQCVNNEKSTLEPDTQVGHLVLFDPAMFQTLVDENFLKAGPGFTLYRWLGYGKVEELYWPP